MSLIAAVVSSPSYVASLGAMIDAHARLGEVFATNPALGDYARMQTQLRLLGAEPGAIALVGGRSFPPDAALPDTRDPRLVFLPSFQLAVPDAFEARLPAFAPFHAWLREQGARGIEIGACGASVFHLAAAGLLDGRTCALSARLVPVMRRLFPRVAVDSDNGICRAGSIWSCSRDTDSAALVARLFAEAYSVAVGRGIAAREPPGPLAGLLSAAADPFVARAQLWIRDRFTRRFRIADLARDLGVSHQSLIRRFRAAGSATPREFVQRTRVDAAAIMLTETRRSVTEIAQLVGYADIPSFRSVFVAATGLTPAAYRRAHRAGS
jgi:transcriptional regulator GlxA family with amidase domain